MIRSAAWAVLALFASWPGCALAQEPRPWVLAAMEAARDDQPRTGLVGRVEYGHFLRPALTIAVRLTGEQVRARAGRVAPSTSTVAPGVTVNYGIPAARLDLAVSASTLVGGPGTGAPMLWDTRGQVRLDPSTVVRVGAARERYSWTVASLDTLVLARSYEIALDRRAAPSWAGELVARQESFGDGNPVRTAYGWVLAPLSTAAGHSVRVGYAAVWQDTERSTWVPADGPGYTVAPDGTIPGRYAPYYSPHDLVTHSALGAAALAVGAAWVKLDLAVGVHATEQAPRLRPSLFGPTGAELQFDPRTFTPYRVGGEWSAPVYGSTSLVLGAAYARSAYYGLGTARLTIARSL
jgi:hypothetical protein